MFTCSADLLKTCSTLKLNFYHKTITWAYFSKFTSHCVGSSTLPQLHPTLVSTAGALGHRLAVFFFSSVTRVYKRGNRLYLPLSRAFHMWILRMLSEYTCFTISCQLLPSSSANQLCVYTYPAPGKPRCPSSHCSRPPPSTQPSSLGYRAASR